MAQKCKMKHVPCSCSHVPGHLRTRRTGNRTPKVPHGPATRHAVLLATEDYAPPSYLHVIKPYLHRPFFRRSPGKIIDATAMGMALESPMLQAMDVVCIATLDAIKWQQAALVRGRGSEKDDVTSIAPVIAHSIAHHSPALQ